MIWPCLLLGDFLGQIILFLLFPDLVSLGGIRVHDRFAQLNSNQVEPNGLRGIFGEEVGWHSRRRESVPFRD